MNFTSLGTGLQNFDKFLDTPPTYQYHTDDIGDIRKKNISDGTISTFNNVIKTIDTINQDLAIDLRKAKKNLDILIKKLIEINDEGKIELSNIAKDISNKIVYIYDNLVTAINQQRCENLKLQLEITKMTKEKNNLRNEVELLKNFSKVLRYAWAPLLPAICYGVLEASLNGNFPVYGLRLGFEVEYLSIIISAFAIRFRVCAEKFI